MAGLRVRERVRHRRRCSVVPPPNWSAQTQCWPHRVSVGTVEARQEPLAKQNRAWGSGEPATDKPRLLAHRARRACAQGWAGILSRAIGAIGSYSLASLHAGCQWATSRARAKGCLTGANDFLLDKSWRQANHRGSSRHLATADTARWQLHVGAGSCQARIAADEKRGAWPREPAGLA